MSVKVISDLKSKAISFEREYRLVPKAIGAASALSLAVIPVSAETGDTGSTGSADISTVMSSMSTELTSLVSKVAVAAAAVVGSGLTIFGLKWAVTKLIGFFRAIAR